jgi:hypothetical protein
MTGAAWDFLRRPLFLRAFFQGRAIILNSHKLGFKGWFARRLPASSERSTVFHNKVEANMTKSIARRHGFHFATAGAALMMALGHGAPVLAQEAAHTQAPSKIPVLTRAQIDALLATPDKVVFIDVRRPEEVSEIGGFPFYLSIQLSELERFIPAIPPGVRWWLSPITPGAGKRALNCWRPRVWPWLALRACRITRPRAARCGTRSS